jgi:23S rRNA pseudouridine2605 synthase
MIASRQGSPVKNEGSKPDRRRSKSKQKRDNRRSRKRPEPSPLPTGPQRIQKLLARAGHGSRRACEEFIRAGRVTVDGVVVTELGTKADTAIQDLRIDGSPVKAEKAVYYLVNKPRGVVCTSDDPQHRPTVLDLVPHETRRVFSVGRLDYESRGLVILTNDGRLTNLLTHPRYGVEKTYQIRVRGSLEDEALERLRTGVWLSEGRTLPAKVWIERKRRSESVLGLVLCEGKNRQVRRMLAKVGHKVLALTRTGIGSIELKGLRDGGVRELSPFEIEELLRMARQNAQAPRTKPRSRQSRARSQGKPDPAGHELQPTPAARRSRSRPRASQGRGAPRDGSHNESRTDRAQRGSKTQNQDRSSRSGRRGRRNQRGDRR